MNSLIQRSTLLLVISLTMALSLTLLPSSAAPIRAGASCEIREQTISFKGKDFICKKKGKKSVWKLLTKSATVPRPLSTPTVKPSPTPTTTPIPPVIQQAIAGFSKYPLVVRPAPPLRFLFGADADPEIAKEIEEKSRETFALWTDFYEDTRPFPILYGSDKDIEWLFEEWRKMGYTDPNQIAEVRRRVAEGGYTSVPFMRAQGTWSNIIPRGKEPSKGEWRNNWINHHVLHAIQHQVTGERGDYLPCWAAEGGAEFYGLLASSRLHGSDYQNHRRSILGDWIKGRPGLDPRTFTAAQWLEVLNNFDNRNRGCPSSLLGTLHYNAGMLINEKLMADFGHEKIMTWWQSLKRNTDWTVGFKETFGIDHESWYRQSVIPYLLEQYKAWIPQPWWRP